MAGRGDGGASHEPGRTLRRAGASNDARRLMVIVADKITELAEKGEITERYYNPGDLFDEVHLVLLNDDRPDPAVLRKTAGRATVTSHNLSPRGLLRRTGYRPLLL